MSRNRRRRRRPTDRILTAPVARMPEEGKLPREPVYEKRRPGRPSLLTQQVEEKLLIAIRSGNYLDVAAQMCGLNPKTVKEWLARGRGRDDRPPAPEYVRFARLVEEAQATAEVLVVGNMVNLSRTKPEAGKFWLRNIAPQRWAIDPDAEPLLPGPAPVPQIEQHTERVERTNVVVVPLEAFPDITRQLLSEKRERHALKVAEQPEPYEEPQFIDDSRLRSAGLRDEA